MSKTDKTKTAKKTGADPQWEALAAELRDLIPQLDSEGLVYLVEQARIHLYNMNVDELNRAALAAGPAARKSGAPAKTAAKTAKSPADGFRIEGTESGSSYYLYYRNNEMMLSKDEMLRIVKIAGAEGTNLEIRERLYNWFDRERRDAFAVIPIADKFDEHLKALAAFLKKNYKIRGR